MPRGIKVRMCLIKAHWDGSVTQTSVPLRKWWYLLLTPCLCHALSADSWTTCRQRSLRLSFSAIPREWPPSARRTLRGSCYVTPRWRTLPATLRMCAKAYQMRRYFYSGRGFGHAKLSSLWKIKCLVCAFLEESSTGATFRFCVHESLHVVCWHETLLSFKGPVCHFFEDWQKCTKIYI